MPLCTVCEALDLDAANTTSLGEYVTLVARAGEGCEGCKFFCNILHTSTRSNYRLSELEGKIINFYHKRLDVKTPEEVKRNSRSWSCDDLLFDYCTSEDYDGEYIIIQL